MLLQDKVLIISGIGPGLGVKLAIEAAREGASGLAIAARTPAKLADAETRIKELGLNCEVLAVPTDISDAGQCAKLVEATVTRFGRLDALVNSAFAHGAFEAIGDADMTGWKSILDTNLIGSMQLTQAAIPALAADGGGAVVMINTMASVKPHIGESGYAASKAALNTAAKYLAIELGPQNIRVNSARMGWMWGVPVQGYVKYSAKQRGLDEDAVYAEVAERIALRRIVTDNECARSALFLVSDYSSGITGATLDINGGEYMP